MKTTTLKPGYFALRLKHFLFAIRNNEWCRKIISVVNINVSRTVCFNINDIFLCATRLDRIIALYLMKHRALDNSEIGLFLSITKPRMTVVDIGANLGYYTIQAARSVGPDGKVFSFEPDEENFRMLENNININGLKNTQAERLAVSSESGSINLFVCDEHSGDHRTYDPGGNRRMIVVPAISLDAYFPAGTKIDVIKIDIQGFEMHALLGMHRVLSENDKIAMFVEFWPEGLIKSGTDPSMFLAALKKERFVLSVINEESGSISYTNESDLIRICGDHGYVNLFLSRE